MHKRALTLALLALAVTLAPVALASHTTLIVGSGHTTDTDFNNAITTTNLSVEGSGTGASLNMSSEQTYNVVDDSGDGTVDAAAAFVGDDGGDTPNDIEIQTQPTATGTVDEISVFIDSTRGADYGASVDVYAVVGERPDGTYGEGTQVATWDPDWTSGKQTITLDSSVSVTAGQNVTWEFVTTNSDNDGTTDDLLINRDDASQLTNWRSSNGNVLDGGLEQQFNISGMPTTANYTSQNHSSVAGAEQANVNLTLENASAEVTIEETDGSTWATAATGTFTSTANHTLSLPETSNTTYRTIINITNTSGQTRATIHDESILFNASSPDIDNGSATPTGDLQDDEQTVQIDVNDSDFGGNGDTLTANLYVDGSSVGSDTLNSNGTASVSHTFSLGGDHTYAWNITDSYGLSHESQDFVVSVPATFYIRNETNTSQLVDSPVTTQVRFFGSDQIITRNTSDGTVDMTGLPVNDEFIVEVNPSEHYTERTILVKSIYQQQTAYVLNSTQYSTVESRFVLDDPTGEYSDQSTLYIEKPVNTTSGTTSYQIIVADEFGVEGVTTTLEEGRRYRIRVENADGESQVVGPYRADTGETVQVSPGPPSIGLGNYSEGWATSAELDNVTLEYRFSDPDSQTSELTVWIHERGNTSNNLVTNTTYTDPTNVSAQHTLSSAEKNQTWAVNFIITRDGETYTVTEYVSNRPGVLPDISREWRLIAGIGLLLLLAAAFSVLNASVGAVVVSLAGGTLWYIGFLDGVTTGASVVLALFISVLGHIYSASGP